MKKIIILLSLLFILFGCTRVSPINPTRYEYYKTYISNNMPVYVCMFFDGNYCTSYVKIETIEQLDVFVKNQNK